MFGLFKKRTPKEKLEAEYRDLLAESHRLSTVDRRASDLKRAEAEKVADRIEELERSA